MSKEDSKKREEKEEEEQSMLDVQKREEKFAPFIKFCRNNNLKEKDTLWADKRIKFFRSQDFIEFVRENLKEVEKLIPYFKWKSEEKGDDTDMFCFLKFMMEEKILIRYERAEDPSQKKLKYPKRLLLNPITLPGPALGTIDKCFYNFNFDPRQKHLRLYSVLFLSCIAAICLFPIWPLIIKKGIFLLSLYLLIFLLGFIFVRILVYFCFRVIGFEFWIFPNIFDDNLSFKEQWKPVISCERCEDGWIGYMLRIVGLFVLVAFFMWSWNEREAIKEQSKETFDDVYQWGLKKITQPDLPSRGLPGYEEFMKKFDGEDYNLEDNKDHQK